MSAENNRDDLYDCLSNARRRAALACLDANRTPIAVCELARLVAAGLTDAPEDGVPTDRIQRIYLSLYHVHLPKLAAAELLRFDDDRLEVAEGPQFDAALVLLDCAE